MHNKYYKGSRILFRGINNLGKHGKINGDVTDVHITNDGIFYDVIKADGKVLTGIHEEYVIDGRNFK